MATPFYDKIHNSPVVAAVGDMDKLDQAIESPCEIVFLLTGNIFTLGTFVSKVKENNMLVFIHLDLLEGFSRDHIALEYIAKEIKPNGIITTKGNLIRQAKDLNLFAIQRCFILDSISVESALRSIKKYKPDAVEIMPGILPRITKRISNEVRIPVITGGLIELKKDVIDSLQAGALGVSTSKEEIWNM